MTKIIAFLAFALALLPRDSYAGAWSKDPKSGCEVWNSQIGGTRTLEWTGTCLNGKADGPGKLDIYIDGIFFAKYEGGFRDGKRDGEGTLAWANGARFEGGWRDDLRSGNGVLTSPAESYTYKGQWDNDKFNGNGTASRNGDIYSGEFRDGKFHGRGVYTHSNGQIYSGEFREGKQHGQGVYTFPDGTRYEGAYIDDKRSGKGVETWPDGERYVGDWRDGKTNGKGLLNLPLGGTYEGDFRDGKITGHGVRIWTNGRRHEGMFKDGNLEGQGVSTWASGARFEGMYSDNYPNGFGTRTLPNGKKYTGQFVNGGNEEQERDEKAEAQSGGFQWGKAAALLGGAAIGGLGNLPSEAKMKVVGGILQDSLAGQQGISGTQEAVSMQGNTGAAPTPSGRGNLMSNGQTASQPANSANDRIYFAYALRYGDRTEPYCSTEGYAGGHGPNARIAPLPSPPANMSWSVMASQPVTEAQCRTWAQQCRGRQSGSGC